MATPTRQQPRFDRGVEALGRKVFGGSGRADPWRQTLEKLNTTGKMQKRRRTRYGSEAQVTLNGCHAANELMRRREMIAGTFRVKDIDATSHPTDVSQAVLRLIERDLLEEWAGRPWPGLEADGLSMWNPIELGWDQFGEDVLLELTDRPHIGLFGQTRSGKSVCQSIFVATGALSDAVLFLLDPKYQLGRWKEVAELSGGAFVGSDMKAAAELLEGLLAEMKRRFKVIFDAGEEKLDRDLSARLGMPPVLLVIDEAQTYLGIKDFKFTEKLAELFSIGASAGLRGVFGTQHPNATTVPTDLRGNMQRIAFRLGDSSQSRVALDTAVVDASEIPFTQQGVCYLDRDGTGLTRMRTNYLPVEDQRVLAARALEVRRGRRREAVLA